MDATKHYSVALTVAGSDSSGGAGIQADLKTFSALGVFGTSVITAVTAQNTLGVRAIQTIDADLVKAQLEAVFDDIKIHAVKIGMLHAPEIVEVVADAVDKYSPGYVVLDPVMIASSGDSLIKKDTVAVMRRLLFPRLTLLTPNVGEAECFTGTTINNDGDLYRAGEMLLDAGCRAVLMKGGHLKGDRKNDVLLIRGKSPVLFSEKTVDTVNTHGTGCTLSSAVAAYLASGCSLEDAAGKAKKFVTGALEAGADVKTGNGHGPLNHFFDPEKLIIWR
ncbi:MAG: bifunctional hydroxymethylpyrimidine kinase/phosphomethylpyrimidine kinase [Candidatus Azobacteroides sp.]|nr:bifunctional hydroxymethylpyrimidine kinase/phosphomethylpyrimidine kinase [Candidatus Azobacteroides sp.]